MDKTTSTTPQHIHTILAKQDNFFNSSHETKIESNNVCFVAEWKKRQIKNTNWPELNKILGVCLC